MHETDFLRDIGIATLGAAVVGLPAYFLGLPLILAYIAAGVALGPHLGFGIIESSQSISTLSEIGLILLMFILGLEINLPKLIKAGKPVLLGGIIQFLACAALGFFWFNFFTDTPVIPLVYLAVISALSSTLVVIKILSEKMELESLPSRITVGILVIQDIWAILFLAIQPDLNNIQPIVIATSLAKAGALIFTSFFLARTVLPQIFKMASKHPELLLVMAMAWCFALCGLADALHLSREMGALFAGVAIAAFPYHADLAAKISSLRDFFITLFFVSLGLQIQKPTPEILTLTALLTGFVVFSRVLTLFPTLYFLRYGNRTGLLTSLNLSQVSEFSLVLGSLGVAYGHLQPEVLAAFVLAFVLTSLLSSVSIPNSHYFYRAINPIFEHLGFKDSLAQPLDMGADTRPNEEEFPQIYFLGFYRDGSSLLSHLLTRQTPSFKKKLHVVDFNPEVHRQLISMGIPCSYGDLSHFDTLRHLPLAQAQLLICTLTDNQLKGTTNLKLFRALKNLAPQAQTIMTADTFASGKELYEAGVDYVYMPRVVATHYLADVMERFSVGAHSVIREESQKFLDTWTEVIP